MRTLRSAGGTVTLRQLGGSVALVAARPSAGFSTEVRSTGPDKVEVRFSSDKRETRIEAELKDGAWRERVEDR